MCKSNEKLVLWNEALIPVGLELGQMETKALLTAALVLEAHHGMSQHNNM